MKQTYEQRVRTLAEKMARDKYPLTFSKSNYPGLWQEAFYKRQREYVIELTLPTARIAVAEMAEGFKEGLIRGAAGQFDSISDAKVLADFLLKEQGLIPDQEPPKESAFEKAIRETVEKNNGQEDGDK